MTILLMTSLAARSLAASPCTSETLSVEGTPVTFGFCVSGPAKSAGGSEIVLPVAATFSTPSRSLRRIDELHFLAGESVSRVLESLDLTQLGMTGTLHLTLAYSAGSVHVEGALLTPGAITIK